MVLFLTVHLFLREGCKKHEQIELLELGKSGIHVAEYLTNMPSKELLEEKLHQAIINAKRRIENK